jgi:hypothetical protein
MILPKLSLELGMEKCSKTGLVLPIGVAQLDYSPPVRRKSHFEMSVFEKAKDFFTGRQ